MKIHILGIAGTKTAPLAILLQRMGHQVSGSDQPQIFPPISTLLAKNKIPINSTPITKEIDQVIVGNSFKSFQLCQSEYQQAQKLKIPTMSYTQYLIRNLIKKQSILVAGSYGKTTITGLLSFVFLKLKLDPSYMFGGQAVNHLESTRFGQSDFSIIEACESINGLDTQSTFLYYPIKYVILTSADWEHKDSFKTEQENLKAFIQLVSKIPKNGLLVYNPKSKSASSVAQYSSAKKVPYNYSLNINPIIPGKYNFENSLAVATLCQELGLNKIAFIKAINQFRGIKRRLEPIYHHKDILIYDDFAQSPVRISQALQAISEKHPNCPIKVFFEPHASFLQYQAGIKGLKESLQIATEIIVSPLKFSESVSKSDRVTIKDYQKILEKKMEYIPDYQLISQHYLQTLQKGDILIHFSSGGLNGLTCLKKIAKNLISR
ncbi:MAG: Mur ligase family protein [Candidatus Shapirobacteria bacterium]|jgi:UDP-N-acetylmuramate: L-alanyl-gamma-D-glutamyl-meso-diaminopimelate ligase